MQICRFGLAAHGFVFAIVGVFVGFAAVRNDPAEAKGFADALRTIQGYSFGWVLFSAVAVGLVAHGVFELVEARFRRIRV